LPSSVRSVFASFIGFPLLMLLALTTPVGTGQGVHRTLALHPLFSHTHVVDGQVLTHHQIDASESASSAMADGGASIGAAAGASAAGHVVAVSPIVPFQDWRLAPDTGLRRGLADAVRPFGRVEAPPDPPPTFAA